MEKKKRNKKPIEVRSCVKITRDLRKFTLVPVIDPLCLYSVTNILDLWLIPNFTNTLKCRTDLYHLITYRHHQLVYPHIETTTLAIKPVDCRKPWWKLPVYRVEGSELIKFLYLNNLLPI